ncbi:DNA polymerase I [Thiotrichales bacterium 19S3-7]|nr:DNA polymerase I [Thiotrichales bacterium 19S3-7]MCF6801351.1 DNA polymerase I [Thiotrichales bacterium 19S3-11]
MNNPVDLDSTKKLVLVDGSSYLFRAFHAMPYLMTSKGQHTGAIYGVINMLKKLPQQMGTEHIGIIFDAKGKNFRHQLYPEYKANRKKMADELSEQIKPLHQLIKAMGFPLVSIEGVEADDVIGTLAKEASNNGWDVLISTSDKDMAQLVNEHVTLVDTMKNEITKREKVIEKFGVTPEQIIDFLALVGDSSDNIPGVPKVGPKSASKWLNEYGNLDNIIKHADQINGKIGENLRNSLEVLPLSYKLATIVTDVPLEIKYDQLKCQLPDTSQLKILYKELEFHKLLKEVELLAGDESEPLVNQPSYECILTQNALEEWIRKIKQAKLVAIDTETTALDPMRANLVGISLAVEEGKACYIPLAHDYLGVPMQLPFQKTLDALKVVLEDKAIKKVGHHIKYDLKILRRAGIELEGVSYDTMLESYVFNSTASRHDMDSLAEYYLDIKTTSFEEVAGKGKNQLTFNQVDLEKATPYAAEDADITLRLHHYFWPKIEKEEKLNALFLDEEMPVMFVLNEIEMTGVKLDISQLQAQSNQLAMNINDLEAKAYKLADKTFNLASTKQLREILFDDLKIPVVKKTPGGQPSTSEEVMQELSQAYELPAIILEHRHLSKLKSTYTDKLPLQINPQTNRVHTSYHQAVAITGRLSSSDPNLQNIPIRTETGRKIRQAFIAAKDHLLVAADYSQIELRIMAHLSNDKGLVKAFNEGADIHRATAAEVLNLSLADVTSEDRRKAKAVNFGLIYGMSAFGLARQLHISQGEAQDYVDLYFSRYPGVKAYMQQTREYALDQGYVETLFGRRLYLSDIKSRNVQRRKQAERAAINAPMQGTAADIIKRAMIQLNKWLQNHYPNAKMIMQVHDELVLEVPKADAEVVKEGVIEIMESAASLTVPLAVDAAIGQNWDQAH